MRYQRFAALVLAAALLLAGCGGTQSSPSAAADQSSDSSRSTPSAAVQTAQKERITDQWSLEKTVRGEMIGVMKLSIHVPQFVCDSPDAAALNEELAAMYVAEYKDYESYPDAEVPQGEESPQTEIINWDAYWYGDCVSLVIRRRDYDDAPWYYSGWCFDFATGRRITTAEMLQRMGLDPDEVQAQMQRQAMQTFDREMAQGAYYESLRLGGELSQMRMDTLEYNELENLCLLLPEQNQLVLRGRYSSASEERWQQLDMEIPLQTAAQPQAQPVLTDTFDGVQVQLKGTQATITMSPAPKTATWDTELNLRLEQAHTYPILGSYNEYVDVCIGQQTDSVFHPVVYLLTKDGVVEYVDVLRCLLFGNAMICQDPIYIANNGVSLERSGNSKVNLRRKDGSVLELADLSSEWSVQDIPSSITGSFNCTNGNWLELSGDGIVRLGVQNNRRIDQGDAAYLGVVPEGVVLAIFTDTGLDFMAAFKMDLYNNLTMTMIDGQNPFAEGETQLQMTYSYG